MKPRRDFDLDSWFVLVTVVVCGLIVLAALGWGVFLAVKAWGWV